MNTRNNQSKAVPPRPYRDGDHYVTRWRRSGKQYKKRFRTGSERTAMQQYRTWLREWEASPSMQDPALADVGMTVGDLCDAYLAHASRAYVKNGEPTSHIWKVKTAMRLLVQAHGRVPVEELTTRDLARLRDAMVMIDPDTPRSRDSVNLLVGIIKQAYRWAAEEGLVDALVFQRLNAVGRLKAGRTAAAESRKIESVPEPVVRATAPQLSDQLEAMVWLQWWTGMRPGEVCVMRRCDIDQSATTWLYTPESHKTEHHGKQRTIALGPKAREILKPWLNACPDEYIFDPRREPRGRRSHTKPHYDHNSYRRAIHRACDRAFPPPASMISDEDRKAWASEHRWSPHQLRHAAATRLKKSLDADAARSVLGHSDIGVTEGYIDKDVSTAVQAMEKYG